MDQEKGRLPMEVLLSSPLCWKPANICSFILKSPDEVLYGSKHDKFRQEMNARASELGLWPSGSNWGDVLGEEDLMILQTYKGKETKGRIDTTSVPELLKLIRNKYKHSIEFTTEQKEKLGWYHVNTKEAERDDYLFVKYWTSKFPDLLPFIWDQFHVFRERLAEFYPPFLHNTFQTTLTVGLMDFAEIFVCAYGCLLESGKVEDRYQIVSGDQRICTIELLTLQSGHLASILAGSSILEIGVSRENLKFMRDDTSAEVLAYQIHSSHISHREAFIIIIANGDERLDYNFFLNKFNSFSNSSSMDRLRVVIFSNPYAIQCMVGKFATNNSFERKPIGWSDLTEAKQVSILNSEKFIVSLQGKQVSFKNTITGSLAAYLQGALLKGLLETNELRILEKCRLPSKSEIYLERKLYNLGIVGSSVFEDTSKNDIFVVTNATAAMLNLADVLSENDITVANSLSDLKLKLSHEPPKVSILTQDVFNFNGISNLLKGINIGKNVHLLRYLCHDQFLWFGSHGSISGIENAFAKSSKVVGMLTEEALIASHSTYLSNESMVFIADKPGMGKSQLLVSIATKLVQQENGTVVFYTTVNEFLDNLKLITCQNVKKNNITAVILKMPCSDIFEEKLISHWLETEISGQPKFDIMLDGLDEVEPKFRQLAFETLKVIQNELPSIRAWVSVRDHMLHEIRIKFGCMGYKIEPFSEKDQIDYLEEYWSSYWDKSHTCGTKPTSQNLRDFAEKCIKIPLSSDETDIAGIPLQCRMIAEINETKILEKDFSVERNTKFSIISLYQQLIERKIQVYLKENKRIFTQTFDQQSYKHLPNDHYFATQIRDGMMRTHMYLAIKLIFSAADADKFRSQLITTDSQLDNELVLEQGIIQNQKPLAFFHRTVAEFLVALFAYNVLTGQLLQIDEQDPPFQNLLWKELLTATITTSTSFRDGRNIIMGRFYSCEYKFPTIAHFLNAMLEKIPPKLKLISLFKVNNLFKSTIYFLCVNDDPTWEVCGKAPLIAAAHKKGYKNLMALLIASPDQLLGLFIVALKYWQYEFCRHLIENHVDFSPQHWHRLETFNKKCGYGILHWVVKGFCHYRVRRTFPEINSFVRYVVQKDPKALEQKDAKGRTPLLLFLKGGSVYDFFVYERSCTIFLVTEMGANVHATDDEGNTVLHFPRMFATKGRIQTKHRGYDWLHYYNCIVYFFMTNGCTTDTINSANNVGDTSLLRMLYVFRRHGIHMCEKYDKVTTTALRNLVTAGADFNAIDVNGDTALHFAIEEDFHFDFIYKLVHFGADVHARNMNGQGALHLAIANARTDLVEWLSDDYPECVHDCDNDGETVLEYETRNLLYYYFPCLTAGRIKNLASPPKILARTGRKWHAFLLVATCIAFCGNVLDIHDLLYSMLLDMDSKNVTRNGLKSLRKLIGTE